MYGPLHYPPNFYYNECHDSPGFIIHQWCHSKRNSLEEPAHVVILKWNWMRHKRKSAFRSQIKDQFRLFVNVVHEKQKLLSLLTTMQWFWCVLFFCGKEDEGCFYIWLGRLFIVYSNFCRLITSIGPKWQVDSAIGTTKPIDLISTT